MARAQQGDAMALSQARFNVVLASQSPAAKKVFEVVPITEAWPSRQVLAALERATRTHMDYRVLEGCLNTLKEAGLVQEPMRGLFQRAKVKPETKKEEPMPQPMEPAKRAAAVDMLAELADRARALADDLDAAAEAIAEETMQSREAVAKLAQFQAVFKSLNAA